MVLRLIVSRVELMNSSLNPIQEANMDPITAAIVAALAACVTDGKQQATVDAYKELQGSLQQKFGTNSELIDECV